MKRITVLAAFLVALLLVTSGCGTSDYVQSVALTATTSSVGGGVYNLVGWGGTLQLEANAIYHSGKTVPITNSVKYLVTPQNNDANVNPLQAPPNTVTLNTTGLMTAVDPPVCTWEDLAPSTATPAWFLTGSYQVIASYNGMQSQPIFVGVASAAGAAANSGACGPS